MVLTLDGAADAAGVAGAWFVQTGKERVRLIFYLLRLNVDKRKTVSYYTHGWLNFTKSSSFGIYTHAKPILGALSISQEWLKLELSNFVQRETISSLAKGMINHP